MPVTDFPTVDLDLDALSEQELNLWWLVPANRSEWQRVPGGLGGLRRVLARLDGTQVPALCFSLDGHGHSTQCAGSVASGIYVEVSAPGGPNHLVARTGEPGARRLLPREARYWVTDAQDSELHDFETAADIMTLWMRRAELPDGFELRAPYFLPGTRRG